MPISKAQSLTDSRHLAYWLGLAGLSFMLPFSLGDQQFVTGILVNTALFVCAYVLPISRIWPVVVLPSLAVLSRGIIFGPLTVFLFYLIPFIWIANLLLVYSFGFTKEKISFIPAVIVASVLKSLLLFVVALAMNRLNILPTIFLTTMGIYQLITAIIGGLIAWGVIRKFKIKN